MRPYLTCLGGLAGNALDSRTVSLDAASSRSGDAPPVAGSGVVAETQRISLGEMP
ncbi:hypothetical protein OUHCRE9_45750 [Enterobacter hormaechei subsp. hoffmannii]